MGSKNKKFGSLRSSSGGEIRIYVEGRPFNIDIKKWEGKPMKRRKNLKPTEENFGTMYVEGRPVRFPTDKRKRRR